MSKYEEAVQHWATAQPVELRYGETRDRRHLEGRDACRLDPDSVSNVQFEAQEGGYCDTCSYAYVGASFTASCACGKVKNKHFNLPSMDYKELPVLIEEIMVYEPVTIEEHPV